MPHVKRGLRPCEIERRRPKAAAQKQGEGHRLGVGVGELLGRSVREQEVAPVPGGGVDRRFGTAQRSTHIVPKHPAERRELFGEAFEIDQPARREGQDRLPLQEVPKNRLKTLTVV